jgi:uncharacterized protein YbjT (DUF2867 family)
VLVTGATGYIGQRLIPALLGRGHAFRRVDLPSVAASVAAARDRGAAHFVYVSVAQPAPAMKAFFAVRAEGEAMIRGADDRRAGPRDRGSSAGRHRANRGRASDSGVAPVGT